jgi:hypothetical protein
VGGAETSIESCRCAWQVGQGAPPKGSAIGGNCPIVGNMFLPTEVLAIPANSFVIYYSGRLSSRQQTAVLEWTLTQRIRLITISRATGLPQRTVFDSPIDQIGNLTDRVNGFSLEINDQEHRIGFGSCSGALLVRLGFMGGALHDQTQSRRTRMQWMRAFRVAGVMQAPRPITRRQTQPS